MFQTKVFSIDKCIYLMYTDKKVYVASYMSFHIHSYGYIPSVIDIGYTFPCMRCLPIHAEYMYLSKKS